MNTATNSSPQGEGSKHVVPDPLRKRAMRIIKGTATFNDRFFPDHNDAVKLIEELQAMGCVIGFTTGVWDLFHIGHAQYMAVGKEEVAKRYPGADHVILVVGVDADSLAKGRKGEERPIVPMDERCKIIGHLRAVDVIVAQTEPEQLYRSLPYDARVISKSTTDLPNRAEMESYCEHLIELAPQAETSTTARVRKLHLNGAGVLAAKVLEAVQRVVDEELRGGKS